MEKSSYFLIGVFAIISMAITSVGSNFTEGKDLTCSKINGTEYKYFMIGLIPSDCKTIATYGKLPGLETEEQRQNWSNSIKELGESVNTELEFSHKYIYPYGKVLITAENSRGYFVVVFYRNLTIEKQLIDEIYAIVDDKARKMGIQEVPVEFRSGIYRELGVGELPEPEKSAYEEYIKRGRGTPKLEIIATYGKLPELKTEEQRWKWIYRDSMAIMEGVRDKMSPYYVPSGPLVAFSINYEGYFEVGVNRNFTVEKPLLDEIYGIIDKEAKTRGIQEVPVRFLKGDMPQPLILIANNSSKDTPQPENTSLTPPGEPSGKPTPDFGLSSGLVSALIGWLFVRKRT